MNDPRLLGASRNPVTDHLDLWASALLVKSTAGRGSNGRLEAFGIRKLRALILELAVRGKLVPQDATDEPASAILEKIKKEKKLLEKEGVLASQASLPEVNRDDFLFSLPSNWLWSRLGEVTNYGVTDKAEPEDVDKNTWVLDLEDVEKETSKLLHKTRFGEKPFRSSKNRFAKDDVIYGKLRPYLDKVLVADEGGVCTTEMMPVRGYTGIYPFYLRLVMKAPHFIKYADESTHGMNLPRLGTDKARMALFPLAPISEQHRIVAKVDELMVLCDQLEQQQGRGIEAHQTLVETLLGTLTSVESAQEFAAAWNRIAEHFDTLFTTEHSIDQLKQIILQLAVMGKLVPQDPGDESASELLGKIEFEKKLLTKKGLLKKEKPLPSLSNEEMVFSLPHGWAWTKFGVIAEFINGDRSKNYPNRSEYVDDGVAWINTGHIEPNGYLTTQDMNFISREKFDSLSGGKIQKGDLVYCLRGATFGKTAFVEPYEEGAIASSLMIVRPFITQLNGYIFKFLVSPFGKQQLLRFDNGSAQPNLSAGNVMLYAFPLPPLGEQHRIVAKVDELMTLCDALKARLAEAQVTQIRLADAVVERAVASPEAAMV